ESAPCATIQHAVDVARDGDTIKVADGTYNQAVVVDGREITIEGESRSGTIIESPSPNTLETCVQNELSPDQPDPTVICAKNHADLTVSDLTVDGKSQSPAPTG